MRSMTMTVTMGCKYRRAVASIEVFLNVLCTELGQNADGKLISLNVPGISPGCRRETFEGRQRAVLIPD
jgi:hypothetical protein